MQPASGPTPRVFETDAAIAAALLRSGDGGDLPSIVDGRPAWIVHETGDFPKDPPHPPCVTIAVTEAPGRLARWADVTVPNEAEAHQVVAAVTAHPQAAVTLIQLLRSTGQLSTIDALTAESFAYGLLQSGPEFAAWLAGHRRHPTPQQDPTIQTTTHPDRTTVTLHRPHVRNAVNTQMRDELVATLRTLAAHSTEPIELTGAGDNFCAGGDLGDFGTTADPVTGHHVRTTRSVAAALAAVAHRVTARVHGASVGAGVELAAFAHHVTATPDATFRLPEVAMGLLPGSGGTVSLPRRIGRHRTAWLALTGASIDAETALAWGLVDVLLFGDARPPWPRP